MGPLSSWSNRSTVVGIQTRTLSNVGIGWHSDKDNVGCIGHRDKHTTCWSRVRDQSFLISFIDLPLWAGLSRSQAGYVGRRGQLYNCVGKSCDYETQKLNRRGSTTFTASLTLPDLYLGHCIWYVGMITWYLGHCIWYLWMIIWYFIKIRLGAVIWERRWQQPLPDPPVEGGYTLWSSIYPLLLLVSVSLVSVSWRDGVMNKSTASIN